MVNLTARRLLAATGLALSVAVPLAPIPASAGWKTVPASAGWKAVIVADATPAEDAVTADDLDSDPIEPVNRFFFQLNEGLRTLFFRPVVELYDKLLPPPVRNRIGDVIDNLRTPVVLANDLLQGEGERAWITTQRFFINSTYGLGGVWDPAEGMGLPGHDEDFGQTLAVWGVGEGFYMVLPVLGPSNPRDALGQFGVDAFLDPLGLYLANTGHTEEALSRTAISGLEEYNGVKDELDQTRRLSLDVYAGIRSMHRQKRLSEIRNGRQGELPPIPELSRSHGTAVSWAPTVRLPGGAPKRVATWTPTVRIETQRNGWTATVARPAPQVASAD